jgi:nicotinamidase-related amidase
MSRDFEDHCWKDRIDDKLKELYASYARDTRVGPRPAVLAIDYYKAVFAGGDQPIDTVNATHPGSLGERGWNAIPPTQQLFAAARAAGIPVIYTTSAGRGAVGATNRQRTQTASDRYDIQDEVAPADDDLIIKKESASAFFGTPLSAHLQKLGVESLIICGCTTSGCVRASAVDAYSFGYHATLVEECTFDRADIVHEINLFDLHHKYADVMHLDDVIAHLGCINDKAATA